MKDKLGWIVAAILAGILAFILPGIFLFYCQNPSIGMMGRGGGFVSPFWGFGMGLLWLIPLGILILIILGIISLIKYLTHSPQKTSVSVPAEPEQSDDLD